MSESTSRCHGVLGVLAAFLGTLLQVKFQDSNASPFATMSSLCFAVFVHSLTLLAEFILETEMLGHVSLCLGALPSMLQMLILLPLLGWLALGIWVLFFAAVLWKTYQQLYRSFCEAILKIGNILRTLIDRPNRLPLWKGFTLLLFALRVSAEAVVLLCWGGFLSAFLGTILLRSSFKPLTGAELYPTHPFGPKLTSA